MTSSPETPRRKHFRSGTAGPRTRTLRREPIEVTVPAVPKRAGAASRNLAALLAALTPDSAQWATPSRVPLMPRTSRWRR